MRTLYQQQHLVSNDFCAIRPKNANEFRGAARGVGKSRNFRRFALILYNYRPRCGDLSNYNKFAAFVQKRLDTRPRCGYNGAGTFVDFALRFRTGADLLLWKKFGAYPQKRLDFLRFCTYSGARPTNVRFVTLLLAPARRPGTVKPHRSGFFRGVFHVEHSSSRSQSRVMSASMPACLSL